MRSIALITTFCFCFIAATAGAQKVNFDNLFGKWEYKSPKGRDQLTYEFTLDKRFIRTTTHRTTELKTEGDFSLDQKGEADRLILTVNDKDIKTRTQLTYYFIKLSGPDTLKLQMVSDRQDHWRPETKRNTMILVRKKEKEKIKDN